MSEHTPGPWIDKGSGTTGHEIKAKIARMGDEFITLFHTPETRDLSLQINEKGEIWALLAYERWVQFPSDNWIEMQKANVQLITAAPELLAACKAALEKCPFPVGAALVKGQLQEAISKAEEEGNHE